MLAWAWELILAMGMHDMYVFKKTFQLHLRGNWMGANAGSISSHPVTSRMLLESFLRTYMSYT